MASAGWAEITTSPSFERDAEDARRGIRVFRVWGYSRAQILHDPTAIVRADGQRLPDYGSDYEGMTLDRYEVRPVGSIYDATALYSNNGRFRPPPQAARTGWSGTIRTEGYDVPYFVLKDTYLAGASSPTVVQTWEPKTQRVRYTSERYSITVTIPADLAALTFAAVREQNNKLHKIYGTWYRFEAGPFTEKIEANDNHVWDFTYTWIGDSGIPLDGFSALDGDLGRIALPPVDHYRDWFEWNQMPGIRWLRPPFHELYGRLEPGVGPGNPAPVPVWGAFLPYKTDPLGWATLPGDLQL